jgi:hypothetical protein
VGAIGSFSDLLIWRIGRRTEAIQLRLSEPINKPRNQQMSVGPIESINQSTNQQIKAINMAGIQPASVKT